MSKRLNLYDIARAAGTTRTVVSLVINGKADKYRIARNTQEKVRAVVRQTGYTPNLFIRDLFLKRRDLVGVQGAGSPETVSAVVTPALSSAGYGVKLATLAADPAAAFAQVTGLMNSGAVVVMGPQLGRGSSVEGRGEDQPAPAPVPIPVVPTP